MYILGYSTTKKKDCHAHFEWNKKTNNVFTKETTNFRSSMLERHVAQHDHVDTLRAKLIKTVYKHNFDIPVGDSLDGVSFSKFQYLESDPDYFWNDSI